MTIYYLLFLLLFALMPAWKFVIVPINIMRLGWRRYIMRKYVKSLEEKDHQIVMKEKYLCMSHVYEGLEYHYYMKCVQCGCTFFTDYMHTVRISGTNEVSDFWTCSDLVIRDVIL